MCVIGVFGATLVVLGLLLSNLAVDVVAIGHVTLPNVLIADEMDWSRSEVQQSLTDVTATHDPDEMAVAAPRLKIQAEQLVRTRRLSSNGAGCVLQQRVGC